MRLAKPAIDLGVQTERREPMLSFWQEEVGLRFDHMLPVGGGVQQHRHEMNGSVLKLNHSREPLSDEPVAGYRELLIARVDLAEPRQLRDPDGNLVTLVPAGTEGITGIGVRLAVRDASAFHEFYAKALELEPLGCNAYRCGHSVLLFAEDASAARTRDMRGRGYRYITIQVWDVDAEHRRILDAGAEEGRAPVTLGKVARISFVRDPDGNWIEISQRTSLTGQVGES